MSDQSASKKISVFGIFIWLIVAVFFMYEFFLRTFIGSVAHQIIPALSLNAETFSILGSAYYLAYALMQLPVGILTDKFGVKLVLACATLLCAAATFYFSQSTSFISAFISRILMGLGSAFAFVCLLVVVINWFPRKFFGSLAGVSQFVGTMGPLLGGGPLIAWMQDYHESWRSALGAVAVFGVILFILVVLFVKNKPREAKQQLIFIELSSPLSQRLMLLLKNKQAWAIALYSATVYVSIALLGAVWGTEYLQAKGLSQAHAADMVSLSWLGYAIGCPLLGAVSDLSKKRKPVLIFCSVLSMLVTICMLYFSFTLSLWYYSILFFGLGISASGQNVGFATIAEQVTKSARATAMGLNNGAIMLMGAAIPPVVSYFIYVSSAGDRILKAHDFLMGLSVMPVLGCVSLLAAIFCIKETFCKPQKDKIMLHIKKHA